VHHLAWSSKRRLPRAGCRDRFLTGRQLNFDEQIASHPLQKLVFIYCARTVHESIVFNPFGLAMSEKQILRFIGNISSYA
jgi:hypothetical protein